MIYSKFPLRRCSRTATRACPALVHAVAISAAPVNRAREHVRGEQLCGNRCSISDVVVTRHKETGG